MTSESIEVRLTAEEWSVVTWSLIFASSEYDHDEARRLYDEVGRQVAAQKQSKDQP